LPRTDASGTTVYLPGGQEILINGSEVSATRYYSFAGRTVAVRSGTGMAGVSSLVCDPHGSVVASVPNTVWTATSVKRVFSDPFGAVRGGSDAGVPGDHRFLGAVRDTGSGLTLLGARYYDESVGQFISVDPKLDATEPAQFNAYSYAFNNPVSMSDPSGMDPKEHQMPGYVSGQNAKKSPGGGSTTQPPPTSFGAYFACKDIWCQFSWQMNFDLQIVGGIAKGAWDLVCFSTGIPGLVDSFTELGEAVSDFDGYQAKKAAERDALWSYATGGPGTWFAPLVDAWNTNPGELIGEGAVTVATFAVPGGGLIKAGKGASEAAKALKAAQETADAALASGRTSGAASGLSVNGQVFTDVSNQSGPRVLNSTVQDALDGVPLGQRSAFHGECAEIGCLSQAFNAGENPRGGTMGTVAIGVTSPGHGLPKAACPSCRVVMDTLGVK
jgi:RHS repeat-associated protein